MNIVYVYNTKKKFTDVTVLGPTGNRTPNSGIKNRCAKPLHHRTWLTQAELNRRHLD